MHPSSLASKPISLQVLVDKEKNQVIFAEANKDFVDVLFSFLTLPMGTVVRLLCKQSPQTMLGCMNNLHKSVQNLEVQHFQEESCKGMLLRTRNSSGDECRKLKVNLDDSGAKTFYICSKWTKDHNSEGLSTISGIHCSCGERYVYNTISFPATSIQQDEGVFVKGAATFIITDDLQVMPMTTGTTFGLLNNLGIRNTEALEKKTIYIGVDEVMRLLKHSFLSKAPLTDTLLEQNNVSWKPNLKGLDAMQCSREQLMSNFTVISLKVVVHKSNKEIIYAEATEYFVNFLFSILTFPLGSVSKLLKQTPSLGCITNLYKTVEGLSYDRHLKSSEHREMLLSPRLALQYGWKGQPLGIMEVTHPVYYYNCRQDLPSKTISLTTYSPDSRVRKSKGLYSTIIQLLNPLSPIARATNSEGFVKGPAMFMVTDDLVITPLSSISALTYLEKLKVPIDDIEERVVSIGQEEALGILEASITSTKVLSCALKNKISLNLKNPKQEKC